MTERSPRTKLHVDADGVRTVEGPGVRTGVWLLALAIMLVGLAVIVLLRPLMNQSQTLATQAASSGTMANPPAPRLTPAPPKVLQRAAAPVDVPPPPDHPAPMPATESAPVAPQAGPVYDATPPPTPEDEAADASANEPSGIAVFPPRGTKPIKRGVIVPEGFELPPGYVRHYQTTDDGRMLPPILMFHPDYQPLDERGQPIPLPEDRVVPPDMAPPGMPVQTLDDPDNAPGLPGGRARASSQEGR